MSKELKLCPFCGSDQICYIERHYIECCSCGCILPWEELTDVNRNRLPDDYIVDAWNNRAESDQEWISCSSRLPEEDTEVLVTVHFDGYKDKYTNLKPSDYVGIASQIDGEWASYDDEYKVAPRKHHVIAWKPLPKPWRDEK